LRPVVWCGFVVSGLAAQNTFSILSSVHICRTDLSTNSQSTAIDHFPEMSDDFVSKFGLMYGGSVSDDKEDEVGDWKPPATHPSTTTASDGHTASTKNAGAGYAVMIPITLLTPVLVLRASETIIPPLDCSNANSSQVDRCTLAANKRGGAQYGLQLLMCFLLLLLALGISRRKWTSPAATLGLVYGSLLTLVMVVIKNGHRVSKAAQTCLVATIIISFFFMHRETRKQLSAHKN
jgi:hypothetical protein